jgi:hypothetical protein
MVSFGFKKLMVCGEWQHSDISRHDGVGLVTLQAWSCLLAVIS